MTDASDENPAPEQPLEFSMPVDLGALGRGGRRFRLSADDAARARIARRLGIPAVQRLEGDIALDASKTGIVAKGMVRAALTRECVSSLEEMTEEVDDAFEVEFLRAAPEEADEDVDIWTAPEVHEGDSFDVGELLVQQLSLAMDPFPRKDGAASLAAQYGRDGEASPFAALRGKLGKS